MRTFLFLLIMCSCSGIKNPGQAYIASQKSVSSYKISLPEIKKDLLADANVPSTFLEKPFDLYAFRKKCGANSGIYSKKAYFCDPDRKGHYWYFFLFEPMYSEKWMTMITYKTPGPHYNDYQDPSEELIELNMLHNTPALPELSYINATKETVEKKFGKDHFMRDDKMIYAKNNKALIFYLAGDGVTAIRYLNMSYTITKTSELPKEMDLFGK